MRKNIIVGLGLALSLAGSAAAQQGEKQGRERGAERGGDQRGPGMRSDRGGPDGLLLKGITLTEGQRAQIAQLRKTQREQMATDRPGQARGGDMRGGGARQQGDTVAVRAAMQKNRQVMEQQRAQHTAAIRGILTADQRVQFDKNVAELNAREAQRAERVGKRGPGKSGR
ncbi:MAG: Spy/CpxP family protein refolding chaperone [Gemmatimonadaceae bacterium]